MPAGWLGLRGWEILPPRGGQQAPVGDAEWYQATQRPLDERGSADLPTQNFFQVIDQKQQETDHESG